MTTAQLRNAAYDAEQNRNWRTAADLWRKAIAVYPPHNPGSALALADKAKMLQRATNCDRAANAD